MKPPETVTLIDPDGKEVWKTNLSLHAVTCSVEKTYDGTYQVVLRYRTSLWKILDNPINVYALVNFLNDQLTFIRNGMWETLAIYQATLGRYTEVPWYDPKVLEPKHEQNYNVRALDEYDLSKGYFDQEYTDLEGCQYCANAKEFTWAMFVHEHLVIGLDENVPQEITAMAIQPMLDDFIKYYPDVFSKLTPLEGK